MTEKLPSRERLWSAMSVSPGSHGYVAEDVANCVAATVAGGPLASDTCGGVSLVFVQGFLL